MLRQVLCDHLAEAACHPAPVRRPPGIQRFDPGKTFLTVFGILPASALMTLYLLEPSLGL